MFNARDATILKYKIVKPFIGEYKVYWDTSDKFKK